MTAQQAPDGELPATAALLQHVRAEEALDVEAVMATVGPDPVWLVHPLWRIEGRAAVREMYARALRVAGHRELSEESIRAIADPAITAWGDTFCAIEFCIDPARYPLHEGATLTYHFAGPLVVSERLYLTKAAKVQSSRVFYGDDFDSVPGVARVPSHAGH
jgi:hypothetical protein